MANTKSVLKRLGLRRGESDVLLALFGLKRASVAELVRTCGMPRTSVYAALEQLAGREMVVRVRAGAREVWEAVSPKRLLAMKQQEVAELKDALPALERLVPNLEQNTKSRLTTYTGVQGLQNVYDLMLDLGRGERIVGFEGGRSSEQKMETLPFHYARDWQSAVRRKGIVLEVSVSESLLALIDAAPKELLEAAHGRASITYVLPNDAMDFHSDIFVFGSRVAIVTPVQRTAVVITDPTTAIAFKHLIQAASALGHKVDLNAHIARQLKQRA